MSEEDSIQRLKTTPVTELNFGNARLRRTVKRAGFDTLPPLLELSEKDIDALFDWGDADEIIKLQGKYHNAPDEFAISVLCKKKIDEAAVDRIISEARSTAATSPRGRTQTVLRTHYPGDGPTSLPPLLFSQALKEFEDRAREAFDELDDRFENVLVYQAFEEFPTDLDELNEAFRQMFAHYANQPRAALNLIERHLRNAFVVYVADRARSTFSEGNLWGNFFNGFIGFDANIQGTFKQIFVDHIERRGMPLYGRDEETNYYFYTALLHGGLSADSWANL